MKTKTFSFRYRADSMRYAINGICSFFQKEHNAWIHLAATVAALTGAYLLDLSRIEFITLIIVSGMVWAAEIFNTAIERMMDILIPEQHPGVKLVKDLAAAAVLISAITAAITGAIIFLPKII